MALTVNSTTTLSPIASAPLFVHELDVSFDASYPTGGEALDTATAALLDGKTLIASTHAVQTQGGTQRWFRVNLSTKKVQAFEMSGAEVANTTDLSAYVGLKVSVIAQ